MSEPQLATTSVSGPLGLSVPAEASRREPSATGITHSAVDWANLARWATSFPAMLGAFLVGRVFYQGRTFFVDPDLWWHIKIGQNILTTHHWPTTDPYSFTVAGTPWLAYEWLGDVVIAAVQRFGGLVGLDVLLIVAASVVMIALYYFATLRAGNCKAGFVAAGLLCSLAFASFNLRPQMFGYLFLLLTLIALERFRQGKRRALWFLPLLYLVWINTHGSWIIGLGLIALYLVCGLKRFSLGGIEASSWTNRQRINLELVLLLCLATLPLTPYGTKLASYPFMVASLPAGVAHVMEWQPMPFNTAGGQFFLAVFLGFLVIQMVLRPKFQLAEVLLFLGGTAMACLHLRFLLLFVPFFVPLLAVLVAHWLPRYDRAKEHHFLNAVLMILVVAAIVWYFPSRHELEDRVARAYPVRAVQYLQQHHVAGPMFNTYGAGGYLIFARWPEQKVFIDGREDLYEVNGVFSDYLEVSNLKPAAFSVLKAYGIRSCLLDRGEPLATVLSVLPDWEQVYSDNISVLYVRRGDSAGARPSGVREH